ncbi:hypothetical protein FOZ63_008087, partial [Perkinsus olseni]
KALQRAGTVKVAPTGLGDDQAEDKFETGFEQWTPAVWPALDAPQDEIVEDPTALPPSPYSVTEAAPPPINVPDSAILPSSSPPGTFPLRVASNTRLTPEGYDRVVNHVCLGVYEGIDGRAHHDLSYHLGDALAVYPSNDPGAVVDWLAAYGLDSRTYVNVSTPPSDARRAAFFRSGPVSLRSVFAELLDLFGKPTGRFYRQLARFASDPEERQKIEEVSGNPAAMAPTVAEALLSFTSARPGLEHLLDLIPIIRPRLYSIASSPRLDGGGRVDLLVVLAKWSDGTGAPRSGLCSTYITQRLKSGDVLRCGVTAGTFSLPTSITSPMVMAGLGTGIAPFRAFVQDRAIRAKQSEKPGPMIV